MLLIAGVTRRQLQTDLSKWAAMAGLINVKLAMMVIAGVTRGQLQKLQTDLSKWAAMAGLMCASLGWWQLEALLASLSQQAAAGVRPELLRLMDIPSMTAANARYAMSLISNFMWGGFDVGDFMPVAWSSGEVPRHPVTASISRHKA